MLDPAIIDQLRTHFSELKSEYTLALHPSEHEKQPELRSLLDALAQASDKIRVVEQGPQSTGVHFDLVKDGAPTGVRFRGVPGGHEFTSLVLAVLNADGKGKLPDDAILDRVRRLKGPIDVRTYVSLSCTNCPDVVQALNLMALIHGDFRHTMIDGGLAADEVAAHNIQAVPAVYDGNDLLRVGKSNFAELLDALDLAVLEQVDRIASHVPLEVRRQLHAFGVGGTN
jgi:alkyl hydroperoxide reductase subunit F